MEACDLPGVVVADEDEGDFALAELEDGVGVVNGGDDHAFGEMEADADFSRGSAEVEAFAEPGEGVGDLVEVGPGGERPEFHAAAAEEFVPWVLVENGPGGLAGVVIGRRGEGLGEVVRVKLRAAGQDDGQESDRAEGERKVPEEGTRRRGRFLTGGLRHGKSGRLPRVGRKA
jgi:hypothetical protein